MTAARRLTPIEVAEGALLADLAVMCQLVWTYLPLPGLLFRFLIPTIFTVIVLRRRLAVGLVALAAGGDRTTWRSKNQVSPRCSPER